MSDFNSIINRLENILKKKHDKCHSY